MRSEIPIALIDAADHCARGETSGDKIACARATARVRVAELPVTHASRTARDAQRHACSPRRSHAVCVGAHATRQQLVSNERKFAMRTPLKAIVITASIALFSGAALADGDGGDNSMSPFYGDSWAALQAHEQNMPAPALQALQDRADAQAAFANARTRASQNVARWRDNFSHMIHRNDQAPAS
jgi:hypothetical protein